MRNRYFIILFVMLIILCLTAMGLINHISKDTDKILNVYYENKLIHTINLYDVKTPYDLPITYNNHTNILRVYKDGAEMIFADCPDKLCIHQGKIESSLKPIVCLPNKVRAEIISKGKRQVDAITN